MLLACSTAGYSQIPEVTAGGVVNAASWSSLLAPGGLAAIFGTNLSAVAQSASPPLPLTLGGTSVTINGVAAPIAFVSPTQVNVQVPAGLMAAKLNVATAKVVVTNAAGSSAPANLALTATNPGFFSADASGCGRAAALNITPYNASINSPANSAAPGDYIALFGTGFGVAAQQPADGVAASGPAPLASPPSLFLDNNSVGAPLYAGLAPSLAGVNQINFQIPASTREGCAVPVSASQGFGSPSVTISVRRGRGQCIDPPIQSYGQIALNKVVFPAPGETPIPASEGFSASFPSGIAMQQPTPAEIVFAPGWAQSSNNSVAALISTDGAQFNLRACAVPGYTHLSAGTIQIQPPAGSAVQAQPLPLLTGGVSYGLQLPAGFIGPGTYTVSGTQGSEVGLQASVVVGSPIQLQSSFPPGTVISSSRPLTVKWTGGDPGTLVKVSLYSGQGGATASHYSYADAGSGVLTIGPACGDFCSFGVPSSDAQLRNAQLSVQVLPAPDHTATVHAAGVTGGVQLTWGYAYSFFGLVLGQ